MALTASDDGQRPVDARVVRTRNDVLKATLDVLVDEGQDAVTHQHLARVAGYSKATLYKHWPTRADLLRDAFTRLGEVPHHQPTGDVRDDLIGEITMFRSAVERRHLDRALAALATLTAAHPEMTAVRDGLVRDGEQVLRGILTPTRDRTRAEAATLMLAGAVLYSALLHGRPPNDDVIAAAVDIVQRGLGVAPDGT